jgi:hypothetical protein
LLAIVISLLLTTTQSSIAAEDEHETVAKRLEAMATFLAKAQRLAVSVDCTYDVVQDSGQKIEFGERRALTLRRPDRARVDVTRRDGARRGLIFDGKQLTAFDVDENVYATAAKSGTVDAALQYYTEELGMRLPLRELFAADLAHELKSVVPNARLVARETIAGIDTDHIAFRGESSDVQVWIARSSDPLPQRIVITYRLEPGQPQFAADFHGWNLNPDVPDSLFSFVPPPESQRIPILTPGSGYMTGEKQP